MFPSRLLSRSSVMGRGPCRWSLARNIALSLSLSLSRFFFLFLSLSLSHPRSTSLLLALLSTTFPSFIREDLCLSWSGLPPPCDKVPFRCLCFWTAAKTSSSGRLVLFYYSMCALLERQAPKVLSGQTSNVTENQGEVARVCHI